MARAYGRFGKSDYSGLGAQNVASPRPGKSFQHVTASRTAANVAKVGELPLIDATDLTSAQRAGRECVSCRKRFPRPTIPVGKVATGEVLYRCAECVVELVPSGRGAASALGSQPLSDGQR